MCIRDSYRSDLTEKTCFRKYRLSCFHPAIWARSYRSGTYLPCLADLDREVGSDDSSEMCNINIWRRYRRTTESGTSFVSFCYGGKSFVFQNNGRDNIPLVFFSRSVKFRDVYGNMLLYVKGTILADFGQIFGSLFRGHLYVTGLQWRNKKVRKNCIWLPWPRR